MKPTTAFDRYCCQRFCHLEEWLLTKCEKEFTKFDENFIHDIMEVLLYTMVNRDATYADITDDLLDGAMIAEDDVQTALYVLIRLGFVRADPVRYDGPYDPKYAPRYRNRIYVADISEMDQYGTAAVYYCAKMRKPIVSRRITELD